METWNSRPMRTSGNMSPLQIWTEGFCRLEFTDGDIFGSTAVNESYGTDNEEPVLDIQTQYNIKFLRVSSISLTEQQLTYIQRHFQAMDENDNSNSTDTFCSLVEHLEGINV